MATEISKLSTTQKSNIQTLVDRLKSKGITSPFAQAAVLAIVQKESNFIPSSENLNYTAPRLLQVFPSRVKTSAQANAIASKPELIGNTIYGGRYGNAANEGYKYRGRGFNQITFKDTYRSIGNKIGRNLVSNPDLLNDPAIAADALIAYFTGRIKLLYPTADINKINDLQKILNIFYDANAGAVGKHLKDVTGGYLKAKNAVDDFYTLVNNNKTTVGGGLFFLILTGVAIWKRKEIGSIVTRLKNKKLQNKLVN
jgi:putative chitinase